MPLTLDWLLIFRHNVENSVVIVLKTGPTNLVILIRMQPESPQRPIAVVCGCSLIHRHVKMNMYVILYV